MSDKEKETLIIKRVKIYGSGEKAYRVPSELAERIDEICELTNKSKKEVMTELVEWALERCDIQ